MFYTYVDVHRDGTAQIAALELLEVLNAAAVSKFQRLYLHRDDFFFGTLTLVGYNLQPSITSHRYLVIIIWIRSC